jgi:hypothetical protein
MMTTGDPDALERRCPRLGHPVAFAYCRRHCDGEEGRCPKVLDCWWEIFDVATYFRDRLTAEEFRRLAAARPQPKAASLVELIQQARERAASE